VYAFILDVEGYPGQFFTIAISLGLLYLRRARPEIKRPFRAWVPAVWIRVILAAVMITAPFWKPGKNGGDVHFWYGTYAVVGVGMFVSLFSRRV